MVWYAMLCYATFWCGMVEVEERSIYTKTSGNITDDVSLPATPVFLNSFHFHFLGKIKKK